MLLAYRQTDRQADIHVRWHAVMQAGRRAERQEAGLSDSDRGKWVSMRPNAVNSFRLQRNAERLLASHGKTRAQCQCSQQRDPATRQCIQTVSSSSSFSQTMYTAAWKCIACSS